MNLRKRTVLGVHVSILCLCGCQTTSAPPDPPVATTITVTPANVLLTALGATQQLSATVRDQNGNAMPNVTVTWTSFNPSVATMSTSGLITAASNGSAQVLAVAAGLTGTAQVTVSQEVAAMSVSAGDGQSAIAGSVLPIAPSVAMVDENGNGVVGKTVMFVVLSGNGSITSGTATSNATGIATVGSWTMGATVGTNTLQATADGVMPLTFTATGTAGAVAVLSVADGDGQAATAGTAVSIVPAVRVTDSNANLVAGVSVVFSVQAGGGSVTGELAVSDAAGVATVGSWILGPTVGANSLQAMVPGLSPVTFTATGIVGAAVGVSVFAGDGQTAPAGAAVVVAPSVIVTDTNQNPVADETVTFSVTAGGGSMTGATTTTDISGIASLGTWTLGATPGVNTLEAVVAGVTPAPFTAMGAGGPASVSVANGDGQTVLAGANVVMLPTVVVRDGNGAVVSGVAVSFAVTGGGGSVAGPSAISGSDGFATVGSWTLGPTPGANELTATVPGLTPATFTGTGVAASYDIEIRQLDTPTAAVATAFANAEARWEGLVVGELSDVDFSPSPVAANACGFNHPSLSDLIDDLMIWVRLEPIDGPGGILGSAGPCLIRSSPVSTVVGVMRFDTADLDNLAANGSLEAVILHEAGHVLGIGSLWDSYGLLKNPSLPTSPGVDTYFDGAHAIAAFDQLGGGSYTGGQRVPVENEQGGQGTRDGHWRESVFVNELMTGFLNPGSNPLSLLSVASLADLNLTVNPSGADPLSVVFTVRSNAASGNVLELKNDIWRGPIFLVGTRGVIRRVR